MSINDFIEATRQNHAARVQKGLYEENYFPLLQIPYLASGRDPGNFEAVATFSHSRRVECVELNGKDYLIYDQYMGQTLNILTRMVFEEKSFKAVFVYLLKYAAEKFLQLGRGDLAIWPALLHNSMKKEMDYFKNPKPSQERQNSVVVQELYLMAHEVYHSLFKRHPSLFSDAERDAREFLEVRVQRANKLISAALKEADSQPDPTLAALKNSFGTSLKASDDLVLELCCDRLATNFCAMLSPQLFGEGQLQSTLISCYRAHLFSRALSFLDHDLERIANGQNRDEGSLSNLESEVYAVYQARNNYIRQCATYYSLKDPTERKEKGVPEMEEVDAGSIMNEFLTNMDAINDDFTTPCLNLAAAFGTGKFYDDFSFLKEWIAEPSMEKLGASRAAEMCLGW